MDSYQFVYQGGSGEIIEKKSRFIATILPVTTEEEALIFIEQIKKKYWDASHNCSAYTIGSLQELLRCNDDGEPNQTAGRPMLDILVNEGLHNTAVVVTRYFGGTLLGTGGLIRAYQAAVKEGLHHCMILEKKKARKIQIETDYQGVGKLQYLCSSMKITLLDTQYTDKVQAFVLLTEEQLSGFTKKMLEATSGRAVITPLEMLYYARLDGTVLLFDT